MEIILAAVFALCLAVSLLLTSGVRNLAVSKRWLIPATSRRHIHDQPIPRLGGVAIYLAFVLGVASILLSTIFLRSGAILGWHAYGLLWPATLVFFLGL